MGSSPRPGAQERPARSASAPDRDDDLLRARRKEGDRRQLVGLVACVCGVLLTAASFMSASDGGGRFIFAWGAILYGVVEVVRGMKMSSAGTLHRRST